MGAGRHLRPLRVHQLASQMLETGRLQREPPWYRVVGSVPPTTTLVRVPAVQLSETKQRKADRKAAGLFRPQRIVYPEDKLRSNFFQDHPWELARPRILVEQDGKDFERYDWSKMQQPGKALNGESVVQRQLWLMENKGLTRSEAYDIARKEFYDLRMEEDIERRIAQEEALAVGAQFGKTYLEVGIELEDKALAEWKVKALEVLTIRRGRMAAFSGASMDEEPAPAAAAAEGGEAAAAPAAVAV
ncbi:mitochondrial ribosomal protein S25 [Pyronema domesticum]|uniref:37S ribosomal protein S25, mitochondrial n=1 Tax=Pyronema omphalodes (strain CBS 100304) TaxID=1076935 RepID=U4LVN1_PYROM|nr:mitochondrial ribosomal protein S25 [Pyronema domesticum]CCX32691.1 Similar to 37S ribosomal protein S25, mitochondrial; acc. no. A1CH36 [Pyronema omphalodes CBS 100304]